jgi:hypothetical protein
MGMGGAAGGAGGAMGAPSVQPHLSINFSKQPFIEDVGPHKIKSIRFRTMSSQEIVKASELHVSESILYTMPDRRPAVNGVVDTRLTRRGSVQPALENWQTVPVTLDM